MEEHKAEISEKTKKILIFSSLAVAVLAVVIGLLLYFFGNRSVKEIPETLSVEKIDGDFCLVAQFNGKYSYKFKLEQKLENEYVLIEYASSMGNMLVLSSTNLNLQVGQEYRFSVCYVLEKSSGKFGESITWTATSQLDEVDYSTLTTFDNTLLWHAVAGADGYFVQFVDVAGKTFDFNVATNSVSISSLTPGVFKVYIIAKSGNQFVLSSNGGEGLKVEI